MNNTSYRYRYLYMAITNRLIRLVEDMLFKINGVFPEAYDSFRFELEDIKQELPIYETTL